MGDAGGRRNVRACHMQQRTVQFSLRCALKVLMVAELLNYRHDLLITAYFGL